MLRDALLPIPRIGGQLLYAVARSIVAARIVEFGTSLRRLDHSTSPPPCVTTAAIWSLGRSWKATKVAKANRTLQKRGCPSSRKSVRVMPSTRYEMGGTVDLLFLDGWKQLYLERAEAGDAEASARGGRPGRRRDPVPRRIGAYLDFVRDPAHGFISVTLPWTTGSSIR